MSLRSKITITLVILTLIPTLFGSLLSWSNVRSGITDLTLSELAGLAVSQEARVHEIAERYITIGRGIASRTKLQTDLSQYNENHQSNLSDSISIILDDAMTPFVEILGVGVFGIDKRIVASKGVAINLTNDDFNNLSKTETLTALDHDGRHRILLTIPVKRDNKDIGILAVLFSERPLAAVADDYTGLGNSGETLLAFRNSSGDAEFITPLRFKNPRGDIVYKHELEVPVTRALLEEEEVFIGTIDYRGAEVFSATRYLDKHDWAIVVKIDKEEALSVISDFTKTLIIMNIVLTLFAILFAVVIAGGIVLPVERLKEASVKMEKGEFNIRLPKKLLEERDEIGTLARAFSKMSEAVAQSRANLEMKVDERTRDLRKFRQAVESATDGIVITDPKHKILYVNQAWEKITGYSAREAVGQTPKILQSGKTPRHVYEDMHKNLEKGQAFVTEEIVNKRKNGVIYESQLSIYPIVENGRTLFLVGIGQDITHRKEVERAKTDFVSIASHQLRTPITGIQWTIERFIKKEKLTDKGTEYLSDIHHSMIRLAELVDSLLNVSRIETGGVGVSPEEFELDKFIGEYIEETKPIQERNNIAITLKSPENLKVVSDKNLIRNIIQSLVSNALEYTLPGGKIDVSVEVQKDEIMLRVKDTGIGIPEKDQATVFEKFHRADNAKLHKADGSGLGLYITKSAAELLGGKVYVRSKVGEGSTFYVEFPVHSDARDGEKTLL